MSIEEIKASVSLLQLFLALPKTLKDWLPSRSKKEQAQSKPSEDERKLSEAQLALSLGYKLCRCAFPPEKKVYGGTIRGRENFVCPKCGANSVPHSRPKRATMEYDPFDY
jgi:hypothetical protein